MPGEGGRDNIGGKGRTEAHKDRDSHHGRLFLKQLSYPLFSALSLSSHALPQTQAALASDRSMLIKAARVFQIAWDVIKRVIPLESLQELTTD